MLYGTDNYMADDFTLRLNTKNFKDQYSLVSSKYIGRHVEMDHNLTVLKNEVSELKNIIKLKEKDLLLKDVQHDNVLKDKDIVYINMLKDKDMLLKDAQHENEILKLQLEMYKMKN